MFAVLFALALATAHAAEELPSYIHACSPQDPKYGECIVDNLEFLKDKICNGIPELDISPNEPTVIDKIVIYDMDNLKLHLEDTKIYGKCDFIVKSFEIDPTKYNYKFDIVFHNLKMDTVYDFDINLLVSIANKGLAHITSDDVSATVILDLKEMTGKGKKQIYASKANVKIDIKSFDFKFDDSEKDLAQLHEILSNTINENRNDIISKFVPKVEETFSKLFIDVSNNVTRNRFDLLFPQMP